MKRDSMVDASAETPVFFPAGQRLLFGIHTRPTAPPNGLAAIILPGGGVPLTTNRNRLSVRVCRSLAAQGYHTMRFDYHGTGESSGTAEAFRLHEPFAEDVTGAIEWIRGQGVERILLIGSCFGARTALAAAVSDDRLAGLILVSVPPRDFEMGERLTSRFSTELSVWQYLRRGLRARHLRGLFDSQRRAAYVRHARAKGRTLFGRFRRASGAIDRSRPDPSRISPVFVEKVGSLVDRGVPILFIYGQDEDFYEEFGRATDAGLGTKLDGAGSLVALETLPGTVHGFTRLTVQDQVADLVTRWAGRLAGVESR